VAIFLYRPETTDDGQVLNHADAAERLRQFLEWKYYGGDEPETPFGKDEPGIE
jgi:hypothetical protein